MSNCLTCVPNLNLTQSILELSKWLICLNEFTYVITLLKFRFKADASLTKLNILKIKQETY